MLDANFLHLLLVMGNINTPIYLLKHTEVGQLSIVVEIINITEVMEHGCSLNGNIAKFDAGLTLSFLIASESPGTLNMVVECCLSYLPVRLIIFLHHRYDSLVQNLISINDSLVEDVPIFIFFLEIVLSLACANKSQNHANKHNQNHINVCHQQLIHNDCSCTGVDMPYQQLNNSIENSNAGDEAKEGKYMEDSELLDRVKLGLKHIEVKQFGEQQILYLVSEKNSKNRKHIVAHN